MCHIEEENYFPYEKEMDEMWKAEAERSLRLNEMMTKHKKKFLELSDIPEEWLDEEFCYSDDRVLSIGVVDTFEKVLYSNKMSDGTIRTQVRYKITDVNSIIRKISDNPFVLDDEMVYNDTKDYIPNKYTEFVPQKEIYREWGTDDAIVKEFEIMIHQDCIYEDSYSGWLGLPMKDGKYWLVYYEC